MLRKDEVTAINSSLNIKDQKSEIFTDKAREKYINIFLIYFDYI